MERDIKKVMIAAPGYRTAVDRRELCGWVPAVSRRGVTGVHASARCEQ